jgi:hypothetical protein
MSDDLLKSKIDLLQEQIDSIEKSGFYTEKEIDSKVYPYRIELEILKYQLSFSKLSKSIHKYEINLIQIAEGASKFRECVAKMEATNEKRILNMNVIDAQILTPNQQEA